MGAWPPLSAMTWTSPHCSGMSAGRGPISFWFRRVTARPSHNCTMWRLSSAVDPLGRTLATMDDSLAAQKAMVAQLPTAGVSTIYSRIGDLFAWLCVAGLLGTIAWGIFA